MSFRRVDGAFSALRINQWQLRRENRPEADPRRISALLPRLSERPVGVRARVNQHFYTRLRVNGTIEKQATASPDHSISLSLSRKRREAMFIAPTTATRTFVLRQSANEPKVH